MRLAEDENCHLTATRDACLLPIKGGGVHQRREGSEGAVRALLEVLSEDPSSLRARWLLNIAHMTLGSYPDGVPERYRIPPSVFASDYPLPRFDNVAAEAGVDFSGLAGGAILEDFDGDRRLDLVWSAMGFDDQMRFLHNKGDGTFVERTREAGLTGETGGLNMLPADYDNDGNVDVLVLRGGWLGSQGRFPLSLLKSDGHGRFQDVTKAAGLLGHLAPTQTAVFFDFDGDGWLDLFVGNESAWIPDFVSTRALGRLLPVRALPQQRRRLLHGDGEAGGAGHRRLREGRCQRRLRQRRTAGPVRVDLGGAEPALPQRRQGGGRRRLALHGGGGEGRRQPAGLQLRELLLRLRQRRLAGPVRRGLRQEESASPASRTLRRAISASRPTPSTTGCTGTAATGRSRTSRRPWASSR